MSRWKIFNFRPLFFVFTMLIVGIFCANYFSSNLPMVLTVLGAVLVITLFYCIKFKKFFVLLIGLICLGVGISGFYFQKQSFSNTNVDLSNKTLTGVIDTYSINNGGISFYISNVKDEDKKIDGNCVVLLFSYEILEEYNVSDKVSFYVDSYEKLVVYENDPNTNHIKHNAKHKITTTNISVCGKCDNLKTNVREKVKNNLFKALSEDKANLIFSCLFGDKSDLNQEIRNSFSLSGVAHLLAVSGLHVGIIVAVFMAICKIFHANKKVRFVLISSFLLLYCYLCSWSPSIVRASIMTVVLLGSALCFREYDTLSAISLAGTIILLLSPATLFDVSFLLSFMCVFGIAMFYSYAERILNKLHINNLFGKILAISLIVNISTVFIMLYYFKEENFMGIISNVFILPLFTFIFSYVFVVLILCFVFPLTGLITMVSPLINLVMVLASFFASIGKTFTATPVNFLSILLYATILFSLSKFNLKKLTTKLMITNVLILLLTGQIILNVYF